MENSINIMEEKLKKINNILANEIISEIDADNDSISDENVNDEKKEKKEESKLEIPKEFKENVIKYVKIDDFIRKKQEELMELKQKKKPCEEYILKYLDTIEENVIEISDGKLRKNKSETKASLSQDIIKKAICEKVKDPTIVEDIMKMMEDLRPLNTHVNIKRTSARPNTKGKKKKTNKG